MKKILFGTTTLVAVGLLAGGASAADKIKLSLGGKQEVFFGGLGTFDDGGLNNGDGFGMQTDTEVYFKGSTKLDNGLTVSAMIQIEAEANENGAARNVDEQYIDVAGAFGKLRLGEKTGVADEFAVRAPDVGEVSAGDTIGDWLNVNGPINFFGNNLETTFDDDSLRLTYFTPSFYGVSAGVSYAPGLNADPLFGRHQPGVASSEVGRDQVQFGLAFDKAISGVTVKADGSFVTTAAEDDAWGYRGGLALEYAGFAVGGSYLGVTGMDKVGSVVDERSIWEAGASYTTGPYAVSFTYAAADGEVGGTDTTGSSYKLAGAYEMGPGVKVVGNVFYAEADSDVNKTRSGLGAVTGLVLSF